MRERGGRRLRRPEDGGERGGNGGLVSSLVTGAGGQVRQRPPWAAGFWPLGKGGVKDWTREERAGARGWSGQAERLSRGGAGAAEAARVVLLPPSPRRAAPTPGLPAPAVAVVRRGSLPV